MTVQPHTEVLQLFHRTTRRILWADEATFGERLIAQQREKWKWLFVNGYNCNSLIYITT